MSHIDLRYGRDILTLEYDAERFEVLTAKDQNEVPLNDVALGQRLDHPVNSDSLEDLVSPGESVLLVVPDATRQVGCGQVVNLIVRRLIANGIAAHDIRIIFATGIHRQVTENEKAEILTPFIAQRIKTLDHDPRDIASIARCGEISGGITVELNRALFEHDHIVLIGGVTFHYFAGFTGGRKLICPGLASTQTVTSTHKLAFDCETHSRRRGVGTGLLDGNAVHEAFVEAASKITPAFAVNTIVNDSGEITELFCGDWIASHLAACESYSSSRSIEIAGKRDLVIVSCGGYPFDMNLIQAHKALDAASKACNEGGTIILLADCEDGLGRSDLMKWFAASDSAGLAKMLCEKYQVNGQTAWSILAKAERFDVRIVTSLPQDQVQNMRMRKLELSAVKNVLRESNGGYILPVGSHIRVNSS